MGNENSHEEDSACGAEGEDAVLEGVGFDPRHLGALNKDYFCLFFRKPGFICLVNSSEVVEQVVRAAIGKQWEAAELEPETSLYGAHAFKLAGIPFETYVGKEAAIQLRQLASQIMSDLWTAGWTLVGSPELSRRDNLTSWFFRKDCGQRSKRNIICLSLSSFDSLMLIGMPHSSELVSSVQQAIKLYYKPGLEKTRIHESSNCTVFTLCEMPWDSTGYARRQGLLLLKKITEDFSLFHYQFYGRANFKDTADSIFFIQSDESSEISKPQTSRLHQNQMCVLSLEKKNGLLLIDAPIPLTALVRETIQSQWPPPGVEREETYDSSMRKFELNGNPWVCSTDQDDATSKQLILSVIVGAMSLGWRILLTADVSRRKDDTSMMVLESSDVPIPVQMVCLSLADRNQIQLIGGSDHHDLVDLTRRVIDLVWPFGLEEETRVFLPDGKAVPKWSLKSRPWGPDGKNGVASRMLMVGLLAAYEQIGWDYIWSMDLSAKKHGVPGDSDSPPSPDVWIFSRIHPSVKDPSIRIPSISCRKLDPTAPPADDLVADSSKIYPNIDNKGEGNLNKFVFRAGNGGKEPDGPPPPAYSSLF